MNKPRTVYTRCPRCNSEHITRSFALCRRDNKTMICNKCGMQEALEDAGYTKYNGPIYWEQPEGV